MASQPPCKPPFLSSLPLSVVGLLFPTVTWFQDEAIFHVSYSPSLQMGLGRASGPTHCPCGQRGPAVDTAVTAMWEAFLDIPSFLPTDPAA